MTITITPAGGTAYTLCDGDERTTAGASVGPEQLSGGKVPGTVDREYIAAEGVEPEAIGVNRVVLSFRVTRTYAKVADAVTAAAALKSGVPAVGAVAMDSQPYMAHARCSYTYGQVGCTLVINYQLEGY